MRARTLTAVVALLLSPFPAAGQRDAGDEQEIQAEVRGTLHSGPGYFITVKPADRQDQEMRVWLFICEDKVLVRQLTALTGKEVVAKGRLSQMAEGSRGAVVPPLGLYFSRFSIRPAKET